MMKSSQLVLLQLLLIVAATYATPTSNPEESHVTHNLHEQRGHPQAPVLHGAVGDKPVQPIAPRDGDTGDIPCAFDSNCTAVMGPESLCRGSYCSCKTGAIKSTISQKCLYESSLGGGCEEEWQCTRPLGNHVTCKGHKCLCTPDASLINGRCYQQKQLSDQCDANEQCIGGKNSACEDHRCVCIPTYIPKPTNDKCLLVAQKYQDPCEEPIQCTEPFGSGSVCTSGQCVCQDSYHFRNHKCMKNLILNEPCGTGAIGHCFLLHDMGIEHVDCIDGKCQCKGNRTPSSDNQKCLIPGETDPGSGGGAESVQPLIITFTTILFARFLLY